MMTVEQHDKVDVASVNSEGNVVLTISDHLEWNHEHLLILQEKINAYLAFVESGEILESYPQAEGRKVIISVYCKYPPNYEASEFLDQASRITEEAGIGLIYEVATDDEEPDELPS